MPPDTPARILIIRPSALGDVCRTVPVLASLRRAWPAAAIDWLVQDAYAPAIERHPALTRAVHFPRRRFGSMLGRGGAGVGEVLRWLGSLRRAEYDLVLDCQGLLRSGVFAWFTRAPRRLGYADARELGWLGLTERVPAPRSLHTVDRMLELARAAGAEPVADLRLYADPAARQRIAADPALSGRRFFVLAATSRWPGKRWPAERFAEAARVLLDDPDVALDAAVLVGAPGERDQVGPLLDLAARDARIVDRVGAVAVADLMALVEASALVIANDSAPLHMAVGFDRPCVALFGPTRTDLVGPYGRAGDVLQHVEPGERLDHKDAALGRALMERIGVDEVVAAARARRHA